MNLDLYLMTVECQKFQNVVGVVKITPNTLLYAIQKISLNITD